MIGDTTPLQADDHSPPQFKRLHGAGLPQVWKPAPRFGSSKTGAPSRKGCWRGETRGLGLNAFDIPTAGGGGARSGRVSHPPQQAGRGRQRAQNAS